MFADRKCFSQLKIPFFQGKERLVHEKINFSTIKVPVSNDEKLQRLKDYIEDTGIPVDIDSFASKEIFEEYIDYPSEYCHKWNNGSKGNLP